MSKPILIAILAALAGCASPSSRIATELQRYGISGPQALCVGDRLQANLSIGQIRQIAAAAGAATQSGGRLTIGDFLRAGSRIEDPKVAIEVARAAAGCGLISSAL